MKIVSSESGSYLSVDVGSVVMAGESIGHSNVLFWGALDWLML